MRCGAGFDLFPGRHVSSCIASRTLPQTAINARARDPMTCGYSHSHESAAVVASQETAMGIYDLSGMRILVDVGPLTLRISANPCGRGVAHRPARHRARV